MGYFSKTIFLVLVLLNGSALAQQTLEATVVTEETNLRCREMTEEGAIGARIGGIPKGATVQIDVPYLISQLALEENKSYSMDFLRQRGCSIFGSAWKSVSKSKTVEGQNFNYIKVRYRNMNCFASLEYLRGKNFSCDEMQAALAESLNTIHPCGKECLLKQQEAMGLASGWSNILGIYGRQEQNANTIESARYLRSRIQGLCQAEESATVEVDEESIEDIDEERVPAALGFDNYLAQRVSPFQCSHLSDPKKVIEPQISTNLSELPPVVGRALQGPKQTAMIQLEAHTQEMDELGSISLFSLYRNNFKTVCDNLPAPDWRECYNIAMTHFKSAMQCFGSRLPQKQNRNILSSFLRDPRIRKMIFIPLLTAGSSRRVSGCSKDSHGEYESLERQYACVERNLSADALDIFKKRVELWDEFNVVSLAPGLKVDGYNQEETIASLSPSGLNRVYKGYESLRSVLSAKFGPENVDNYSHVWGGGGLLARTEDLTVDGQFGQIISRSPLVMHMVIDPSGPNRNGNVSSGAKTPETVAERLAHENFHAQDFIDGKASLRTRSWSEHSPGRSPARRIFAACGSSDSNADLRDCQRRRPELFNFRGGSYQAGNVYEFYGSMANIWIENARTGASNRSYACQNAETERLWREMETQLLGQAHTSCN